MPSSRRFVLAAVFGAVIFISISVNISGRTITVYSSGNTSTSRVFVVVKGYQW